VNDGSPRRVVDGIPVVKMNGTGNEFVLVDERFTPLADAVGFAVRVCDPVTSIGADGLLLVGNASAGDARMRIINADGSEAEMCGNGIRCVARYLDEHDGESPVVIETVAGPIRARVLYRDPYRIAVEMPAPRLGTPFEVAGGFAATPVDVGNPHVVIRVDAVGAIDLAVVGPPIEHDPQYPHGTNVHFVSWDGAAWRVRHWERGAGATQACGTGAVAVAAVLIAAGEAASPVVLQVPGGALEVAWTPGEPATLTGDAVREFEMFV
jgi:diaminopimelate epimerase